jgi:hypothetical protein
MFQTGRAIVSGQTFSRSRWFRTAFKTFQDDNLLSADGNKLSAVQDGTIQLSGFYSLVDLSRCFRMATNSHGALGFPKTAFSGMGSVYIGTCSTILLGKVIAYNFKKLLV